jgi:hypothetical protein
LQELVRQTDAAMMDLGTLDMDVKHARQLIADIKRSGTNIYDGLAKEQTLKEARQLAVAKQTDKADVGHAIQVVPRIMCHGHFVTADDLLQMLQLVLTEQL